MGVDDGAGIGGPTRGLLLAAFLGPPPEILPAPGAGLTLMQRLLDGLTPPAEAALGLAGVAGAEFQGDLGLEGATSVAGESPGPRSDQGVEDFGGVLHEWGPP